MIQKLNNSTPVEKCLPATSVISDDTPGLRFQVKWIDSVEQMKANAAEWQRLFEMAQRPNFCFAPSFLIPAFEHLNEQGARLLVVESKSLTNDEDQPVWCVVIPLVSKRMFRVPVTTMEIWKHEQCFDATPLLRRDCANEAMRAAIEFLVAEGVSWLSSDTISADGEFGQLWHDLVKQHGHGEFVRQAFDRACFRPMEDHEAFTKKHVSKSIRKNTRRLLRRIVEQGEFDVIDSDPNSDFEKLARQFLEVEASGWKRESGTALICNESTKRFFLDMVEASAQAGLIRFLSLELDQQPVAMLCDLYSDRHGFSYKTGFDEAYSNFSPGLLAEVLNIEKMHGYDVEYVDSCTEPDNNTMNRIWGDRLAFQKSIVSLKPGLAAWILKSLPIAKGLAQRFRKQDA
ncbi:MAG: GNAT family N-acetyltransferase [Planctomycetota bacterium]